VRVATLAGAVTALNPSLIYSSGYASPENLQALLLLLVMYFLLRTRSGKKSDAAWAGVFIALTALTKTFYYVLPVIAAVWLFFQPGAKKAKVRSLAIIVVAMIVCATPWVVRNWMLFGKPRLASTDAAMVLYTANTPSWLLNPIEEARFPHAEYATDLEEIRHLGELERDRWFVQRARETIMAHPGAYTSRVFERIWLLWKPYPYQLYRKGLVSQVRAAAMLVTYLPILSLFLAGVWIFRKHWRSLGIIYLLLASVTAGLALAYSVIRYRTPMEPLLIVVAAPAAICLLARWTERRRRDPPAAQRAGA
jgi:4-amino-4-deoxy-L-arabinose transferase-like glycosyltransferase